MIRRPLRAALLGAALLALPLPVAVTPAQAQWTVFDPWNYAQNILSAARALDQINNQIASLQNEAQMLINQARNLASLPYSSLMRLQQSFARTQQLIARAQRLAYEVTDIERAFTQGYGSAASLGSSQQMFANARERWQTSVAGFQDALLTQATVVGNLTGTRAEIEALIGQSQGATGALQAAQAGNQLLALQSQQIADLTALLAAQGRAQALEAARVASGEERCQVCDLLGLKGQELVACLRRLERSGRALALADQRLDLGAGAGEVADHRRLGHQRVLEAGDGGLPALARTGEHLLARAERGAAAVALGEGALNVGDLVGESLGAGDQLLGLVEGLLKAGERRVGQAREVARLVDQHLRLVLERGDLVVDLVQRAGGGEDVLRVVPRVEDRPLRLGGRDRDGERQAEEGRAEKHGAERAADHGVESSGGSGRSSAAQSRPRRSSQARAKPARPWVARVSAMAAWSVLEEAAQKASATSESPSSKSRLPRRDWQ
jgi:P-type conjugative transfer protein TrbJ